MDLSLTQINLFNPFGHGDEEDPQSHKMGHYNHVLKIILHKLILIKTSFCSWPTASFESRHPCYARDPHPKSLSHGCKHLKRGY